MGYIILGDALILFGIFFGIFGSGSALTSFFGESNAPFTITIGIALLCFLTGLFVQLAALGKKMFFSLTAFALSLIQLSLYCLEVVKDGFNWWLSPIQEFLNSPSMIGRIGNYVGVIALVALILLPATILPLMKKDGK